MSHTVTLFKPCELQPGDKIRIVGSKRGGDWEVIKVGDIKMTLRCPVSGKEMTWDRFCYFMDKKKNEPWPLNSPLDKKE
ncbi:hypothetical protein SAMN02746065_11252 [Desulfocicer vacuolatum DSM 3385]|uniref:Uncharacterized protein n=1 Tax=Desulfocicer vacuolatum DSM 3385 TaxID=1121400 RepID=A0A1W2CI46_9BACT|nr:hypothetical protein [Desulfocicer vacuolatum]SMC84552.1 hypothetical protein SAMN02746065_11252 [Desulfocicer vacuolatum DSM 3385]